ncbi:unnamed protein product [Owenia fusiformis]|uniref:Uncharacterized protein n=1 Tax=Owenia fusiformis TaxID=6347 RepID=A0A8J1XZD0_OWEFU|nr:unnamed protein product [Owenia fusiformis]
MRFLSVLLGVLVLLIDVASLDPICCTQDQWEGILLVDEGMVFIDAVPRGDINLPGGGRTRPETAWAVINTTADVSYDYTNKRTKLVLTAVTQSPLIPRPGKQTVTYINDYVKHVSYQIDDSDGCQKSQIDNMTKQCVPGDALFEGSATLGAKGAALPVDIYSYVMPGLNFQTRATVSKSKSQCIPISMQLVAGGVEADSGTIWNVEAHNITAGIKDPSVFEVPAKCNHVKQIPKRMVRNNLHGTLQKLHHIFK